MFSDSGNVSSSLEEHRELALRFQRIVNETQLPRLNKMISVLNDDILGSVQDFRYVLIDDLDRDWVDERIANDLIRCLFRAVLDLQKVRNLKVLVALRTNIFDHLNFGPKGGQEEKYRSLTHRLNWTNRDLENVLDERVRVMAERQEIQALEGGIKYLLPLTNKTRGNALTYILDRTLLRPRDAIAYFNECLHSSAGTPRISWAHIHSAETPYSRNRLLALRDEWKPTFPGIDRVFGVFSRAPAQISPVELRQRLDNAVLLISDEAFPGSRWMTELADAVWTNTETDSWIEPYQGLVAMLYDIGFIGCSQGSKSKPVYSHESPGFADSLSNLKASAFFYVHKAFRPALDIQPGTRSG